MFGYSLCKVDHQRSQLSKSRAKTILQVARGIGDNQKSRSVAVGPPELLESARIERHWSKALHSVVARPGYHRVAAALKNGHANMTIVINSEPVAICPSHCIKTLHACTCNTWSSCLSLDHFYTSLRRLA